MSALEHQRVLGSFRNLKRSSSRAWNDDVLLYYRAIMLNLQEPSRFNFLACRIESWRPEPDVEGLPFAWRPARVDERGRASGSLFINPTLIDCSAIVNADFFGAVAVENLQLV